MLEVRQNGLVRHFLQAFFAHLSGRENGSTRIGRTGTTPLPPEHRQGRGETAQVSPEPGIATSWRGDGSAGFLHRLLGGFLGGSSPRRRVPFILQHLDAENRPHSALTASVGVADGVTGDAEEGEQRVAAAGAPDHAADEDLVPVGTHFTDDGLGLGPHGDVLVGLSSSSSRASSSALNGWTLLADWLSRYFSVSTTPVQLGVDLFARFHVTSVSPRARRALPSSYQAMGS